MKGRPKSEGRNPKEIRSPKAEGRRSVTSCYAIFEFRASAFFRPSDFGLRILLPTVLLLRPHVLLAADTNVPAPEQIPALRPPRAELPPTFWEQNSGWVMLGVVVVVALMALAAWWLTRPRPPVVVLPEVHARQALGALRRQPEDGALLSRVSQILREYVIAAFRLPPGEHTTSEFCNVITLNAEIGPELAAAFSEFLRQCDQRKFSPPAPAPPLGAVEHALQLVEQAQARIAALRKPETPGAGSPPAKPHQMPPAP
jgi:hypothetical protein